MPELTGRELDVAVAEELFGWSDFTFEPCGKGPELVYGYNPTAKCREYVEDYHRLASMTWAIESKIELRGLIPDYICYLLRESNDAVGEPPLDSWLRYWQMRRATPEQICRAALAAVRGAGNDPARQLP